MTDQYARGLTAFLGGLLFGYNLILNPVLAVCGFAMMIYAIMLWPKT